MQTNLFMLVTREEDVEPWEQRFLKVLEKKHITLDSLKFQCATIKNNEILEVATEEKQSIPVPKQISIPQYLEPNLCRPLQLVCLFLSLFILG